MTTRVYQYGLMPAHTGSDVVREQLWLAHRYRNDLTAWVRAMRDAERDLERSSGLDAHVAAVALADAALSAAIATLKSARVGARSKADTAELRASVVAARNGRRAALVAMRDARASARTSSQAARDEMHERWLLVQRSCRAASGLRHGTYTLVEEALAKACSDMPLWDAGQPNDPRFCRWAGGGSVGVQVQGGVTASELLGEQDTRVQIGPGPERVLRRDGTERRRGRNAELARTLRLRVGSNEDRSPIWAEWIMIMDRPLPEGAVVKRINATVRRIGPRERWTAELTVQLPDDWRREPCGTGGVALDLGWRSLDDEYRIGAWLGEDGQSGECRVGSDVRGELRKVDDVASIRDRGRDHVRRWLCAWRHKHVDEMPEWLLLATSSMHQWEQQARFGALTKRWARDHANDYPRVLAALEKWRYHDYHLWCWESSARVKALARRREQYRVFAAGLARRYGVLVLERFDLRPVVQRRRTEDDLPAGAEQSREDGARANRHAVAPSELRLALVNAFRARGGRVVEYDAAWTTATCRRCGHVCQWDQAAELRHTCEACGSEWDQDYNASTNLLRLWRERPGDARDVGGARKQKEASDSEHEGETRRQRVTRLRVEKLVRMAAARKVDEEAA